MPSSLSKNPSSPLPASCGSGDPPLWLHRSGLCLPLSCSLLLLCVHVFPTSLSCEDTCHWIQAHLGNPGWSPAEILTLITLAKTLFPNKVTVTGSGVRTRIYLFRSPLLAHSTWLHENLLVSLAFCMDLRWLCHHASVIWKLLVDWLMQRLSYFILHCQRVAFVNITTHLVRQALSVRAAKLTVADTGFPKFWFSLESLTFIIGSKHWQSFSLKWQEAHFVHFWENVCQTAKSES